MSNGAMSTSASDPDVRNTEGERGRQSDPFAAFMASNEDRIEHLGTEISALQQVLAQITAERKKLYQDFLAQQKADPSLIDASDLTATSPLNSLLDDGERELEDRRERERERERERDGDREEEELDLDYELQQEREREMDADRGLDYSVMSQVSPSVSLPPPLSPEKSILMEGDTEREREREREIEEERVYRLEDERERERDRESIKKKGSKKSSPTVHYRIPGDDRGREAEIREIPLSPPSAMRSRGDRERETERERETRNARKVDFALKPTDLGPREGERGRERERERDLVQTPPRRPAQREREREQDRPAQRERGRERERERESGQDGLDDSMSRLQMALIQDGEGEREREREERGEGDGRRGRERERDGLNKGQRAELAQLEAETQQLLKQLAGV
ncbi:hypothetical protein KIPB_004195 [Kipferlia bialata]|uniref:Uncharacterized protein n=1 Tax=Kipferlia bialata TaxID=797122 RepID=A0A9K3CVM5_9EUKA|nr:hypothetical protein KIPB_004195 [Kipferlia bialata]|eukprot:g4195.t1